MAQHVCPQALDESQVLMMKDAINQYSKGFKEVLYDSDLEYLDIKGEAIESSLELEGDVSLKLRAMGDYQFGEGAGDVLFHGCRGVYSRTGRLRHIYSKDTLVASVRASDGVIIPALEGANRLLVVKPPNNRVVIEDAEVCSLVREGKSAFAKFIVDCDPDIVPGSEVIIVDKKDNLVNWGRALLDAKELLAFKTGVGVKTRGSLKEK